MDSALPTSTGDPLETRISHTLPPLRIGYETGDPAPLLGQQDVLAVIGFGDTADLQHDGYVRVGLDAVHAPGRLEVWRGSARVRRGVSGEVRWSSDGDYTFAVLEIDEAAHGGIAAAARHAYALLGAWCSAAPQRHVLRIWNYLDAINDGDGDTERYRQFCAGRALGMDGLFAAGYPAATAIGRRDGRRVLQLYWLAARDPGVPLENPRQMSAWRYPRQYGPKAPNFARAMRGPAPRQLYISGTAAIVGHTSHHVDDCLAQLDETLLNIDSLLGGSARFGEHCALKVYVRHARDAAAIEARLRERHPDVPLLVLLGDVCRAELLIEIDGVHNAR